MKFKKLELGQEGSWVKRHIWTSRGKKTILYMVIGAIAGFLYFYLTEGNRQLTMETGDILKSMLIGVGFGLFITNSPCARGRC